MLNMTQPAASPGLTIRLENLRVYEMKNKIKSLNFDVVLDVAGDFFMRIEGFRLINGAIWPPKLFTKRQYIPHFYTTVAVAQRIWKAVAAVLEDYPNDNLTLGPFPKAA